MQHDVDAILALPFHEARARLAAGGKVRQKHSGGASSLIVDDGSGSELVVHYPAAGAPQAWRLPADPRLPALARVDAVLASPCWDPPLDGRVARGRVGTRLMYNPGRRAAFLVHVAGAGDKVIKLLSADEAPASLRALRAVAAAGLDGRVTMPRLLATSADHGATLQDFLPGDRVQTWTPELLDELADILASVHGTRLDGLPSWTPADDVRKLQRVLRRLEITHPADAAAARPALDALDAHLAAMAPPARTSIHRDFGARHVLLLPGAPRGRRLGVLDWDSVSLGPREKDLATILPVVGPAGATLADRYERVSRAAVDRACLHALLLLGELTRACRRLDEGKRQRAPLAGVVATVRRDLGASE